jgi:hypothetical protein
MTDYGGKYDERTAKLRAKFDEWVEDIATHGPIEDVWYTYLAGANAALDIGGPPKTFGPKRA